MSYEDIIQSAEILRRVFSLTHRTSLQENPNHNLWNNNGTWWASFTILNRERFVAERVRISLKTRDLLQARNRRDKIFNVFS